MRRPLNLFAFPIFSPSAQLRHYGPTTFSGSYELRLSATQQPVKHLPAQYNPEEAANQAKTYGYPLDDEKAPSTKRVPVTHTEISPTQLRVVLQMKKRMVLSYKLNGRELPKKRVHQEKPESLSEDYTVGKYSFWVGDENILPLLTQQLPVSQSLADTLDKLPTDAFPVMDERHESVREQIKKQINNAKGPWREEGTRIAEALQKKVTADITGKFSGTFEKNIGDGIKETDIRSIENITSTIIMDGDVKAAILHLYTVPISSFSTTCGKQIFVNLFTGEASIDKTQSVLQKERLPDTRKESAVLVLNQNSDAIPRFSESNSLPPAVLLPQVRTNYLSEHTTGSNLSADDTATQAINTWWILAAAVVVASAAAAASVVAYERHRAHLAEAENERLQADRRARAECEEKRRYINAGLSEEWRTMTDYASPWWHNNPPVTMNSQPPVAPPQPPIVVVPPRTPDPVSPPQQPPVATHLTSASGAGTAVSSGASYSYAPRVDSSGRSYNGNGNGDGSHNNYGLKIGWIDFGGAAAAAAAASDDYHHRATTTPTRRREPRYDDTFTPKPGNRTADGNREKRPPTRRGGNGGTTLSSAQEDRINARIAEKKAEFSGGGAEVNPHARRVDNRREW